MTIHFHIPFFTTWGQRLLVVGNLPILGNGVSARGLALDFVSHESWRGCIECTTPLPDKITYHYVLYDEQSDTYEQEWGEERTIDTSKNAVETLYCFDQWRASAHPYLPFMSIPFQSIFLRHDITPSTTPIEHPTHTLEVAAPLLPSHQTLCVIGSVKELGAWETRQAIQMHYTGSHWSAQLCITTHDEIAYKYAVCEKDSLQFLYFEEGKNRLLRPSVSPTSLIRVEDGFVRMGTPQWKGAGVSIPLFSIRTRGSFGVGDFVDLRLMVDWANKVGLKMIQVLPLNDSNGTNSSADVLPYAAISAFALNPLFLNLKAMGSLSPESVYATQYLPKRAELNAQDLMPFMEVIRFKIGYAKALFEQEKATFLSSEKLTNFLAQNRYWLVPYAAYCVLKEQYQTNDYNQWGAYSLYDQAAIDAFVSPQQPHYEQVAFWYFVQYHLFSQLAESVSYAHQRGIAIKGDMPIGVNRYSVDTWQHPTLFCMDKNAGAPPDMFAVKGQNWALPTYNWEAMQLDNFAWWKERMALMERYFDSFRIDHILGFFRIWQIPTEQIEGIMGHLYPSVPIYRWEIEERGVRFDYERFCRPYITDRILDDIFGKHRDWVQKNCVEKREDGRWQLLPDYATQIAVENKHLQGEISESIKWGLFDLISNVLLFEVDNSHQNAYYPRYAMHYVRSYAELDPHTQQQLDALYIDYYYHRQDSAWYKEGMEKLSALKRTTHMLVCGEDLGMMTHCVTSVMKKLGILSLEVQRTPKSNEAFAHPHNAPYLSVVTPSTHDMSTIRGWWEENQTTTQHFYQTQLGHNDNAPYYCEWWIVRDIVLQHLHSPSMWSVFQWQDLLGMSPTLRRENPHEERINDPANSLSSWRYRMHLYVEDLMDEKEFNEMLHRFIETSGR